MKAKGIIKGMAIGIFVSLVIPFFFSAIGQTLAGGRTNFWGSSRLYLAFSIPMIVSLTIMGGYLALQKHISTKKMWWISFFVTFVVGLFTGTVGNLISEIVWVGNLETLNVGPVIGEGVVISLLLLPITIPLCKFILYHLHQWIQK